MDEKTTASTKQQEFMTGLAVFAVLAVLTAIEYFLGISHAAAIFLWAVAILKGGLVLWYFMHLKRLFSEEGGA